MLKYIESFDHIGGPSTDLSLYTALGWVWGGAGFGGRAIVPLAGRFGGAALVHNVGAWYPADEILPVIPRKCKKLVLGFSVRGANTKIGAYFRYGTYVNFTIVVQVVPTGTMTVTMGTGQTSVGSGYQAAENTPDPAYPAIVTAATTPFPYADKEDFHFIELYLDVTDYMNGRAKVAVDGRTYYDKQGIVTAAHLGFGSNPYDDRANLNGISFFIGHSHNYGYSGQEPIYIDSLYLADDEGGYQDDFLGDVFVKTAYPVADGTKRNWMPYVNGTIVGDENPHHELIDSDPLQPGDETEYLEADQDLTEEMVGFGTDPIPAGSELIAVNHRTMFRNVASPGSPKMNSLVPLFQMIGNPIVRTDSLSKKLTGWTYSFLDVYYDIIPVSAALWEEYLLEQAEFGFMLRTAENLQRVEEETQFADEAIVEGDGEDG
jgi:hypothetical protein